MPETKTALDRLLEAAWEAVGEVGCNGSLEVLEDALHAFEAAAPDAFLCPGSDEDPLTAYPNTPNQEYGEMCATDIPLFALPRREQREDVAGTALCQHTRTRRFMQPASTNYVSCEDCGATCPDALDRFGDPGGRGLWAMRKRDEPSSAEPVRHCEGCIGTWPVSDEDGAPEVSCPGIGKEAR